MDLTWAASRSRPWWSLLLTQLTRIRSQRTVSYSRWVISVLMMLLCLMYLALYVSYNNVYNDEFFFSFGAIVLLELQRFVFVLTCSSLFSPWTSQKCLQETVHSQHLLSLLLLVTILFMLLWHILMYHLQSVINWWASQQVNSFLLQFFIFVVCSVHLIF